MCLDASSVPREVKPFSMKGLCRAGSWESMWQEFMRRVLAEIKVEARFTEHDLRAKGARDAEILMHVKTLPAHAGRRRTTGVYRRKPGRVKLICLGV
jgi:hypothetical protein